MRDEWCRRRTQTNPLPRAGAWLPTTTFASRDLVGATRTKSESCCRAGSWRAVPSCWTSRRSLPCMYVLLLSAASLERPSHSTQRPFSCLSAAARGPTSGPPARPDRPPLLHRDRLPLSGPSCRLACPPQEPSRRGCSHGLQLWDGSYSIGRPGPGGGCERVCGASRCRGGGRGPSGRGRRG